MKWKIPLVPHRVGNIVCPRPQIIIRVVSRYGLRPIRSKDSSAPPVTSAGHSRILRLPLAGRIRMLALRHGPRIV